MAFEMTIKRFKNMAHLASAAVAAAMVATGCNAKSDAAIETRAPVAGQARPVARSGPDVTRLSQTDRVRLDSAAAACRSNDANAFLTAYAGSAAVRRRYTAAKVEYSVTQTRPTYRLISQARIPAARYTEFPIVMEDYYFKSAHPVRPGDRSEYILFEINQSQSNQLSVEWTRVHYDGKSDGGDDLGNAFTLDGKPYEKGGMDSDGQLLFEPSKDCWQLVSDERHQRSAN